MAKYTFNMSQPYAEARGIAALTVNAEDISDACDRIAAFTEDEGVVFAVESVTVDIDVSAEARAQAMRADHDRRTRE